MASKQRFYFDFSTVPGGHYQVEFTENLEPPAWLPLGPAQTAPGMFLEAGDVSNCFTNQHRFYRAVRFP